ncbi:MAG: phasin family protein [Gammaproteobacteria bacterium]
MRDKGSEFVKEAQEANRSALESIQGLAETQFKILQRLADVQREQFQQAVAAAREQLRLISQVKDPREYASAQAKLVQNYGQEYLKSMNDAVGIMSSAWEAYVKQMEKSVKSAADTFRKAADTTTRGAQKPAGRASQRATKGSASKKSS